MAAALGAIRGIITGMAPRKSAPDGAVTCPCVVSGKAEGNS